MSGFDSGTIQGGIFAQTKQFGSILRGLGPPSPAAGVVGDVYVDTQTWFLYVRRSPNAGGGVDGWGANILQVPAAYQSTLKWFSSARPDDSVGAIGDHCLAWGGYSNYGVQPSIYGPKTADGWPENGNGPTDAIDVLYGDATLPEGLTDEGDTDAFSNSTQAIVAGLLDDEYILAVPVPVAGGTPVYQAGLAGDATYVPSALNPLYTTQAQHAV